MPLNSESQVSTRGPVKIADRVFMVCKLSITKEDGLLQLLYRLAKEAYGPGGFFQRLQPKLEWMRQNMPYAMETALKQTTNNEELGVDVSPDEMMRYRATPKGVAREMFERSRETHPEIELSEWESIINEVNAHEVHLQILEVITDKGKVQTQDGSSN